MSFNIFQLQTPYDDHRENTQHYIIDGHHIPISQEKEKEREKDKKSYSECGESTAF